MKELSQSDPKSEFNFAEEIKTKKVMHWMGTPCFIKRMNAKRNEFTIIAYDGAIYSNIKSDDLEDMDPADTALFI